MKVSESFYSIQGEGISQGVPAYFIRLQGCNLHCVWCDTLDIWKTGNEIHFEQLKDRMKQSGQLENILHGKTHLVWTGGEPTLQEQSIKGFLDYLKNAYPSSKVFSELETNGTILVGVDFFGRYIQQVNCSPKLSNSGMNAQRRINVKALRRIMQYEGSWFKFVVSTEDDLRGMENDYIIPLNIPKERVILMPKADNLEDLAEKTRFCFELTKKYGYRTITRGHILAWNKKKGV